ncbi:MAG: hypothetical protein BGN88_00120 [Clostridiales bacterium 43-6]|nr:MAG: hypothetical protein BGN88_00120 [Clostridiales bacterium 43-6]
MKKPKNSVWFQKYSRIFLTGCISLLLFIFVLLAVLLWPKKTMPKHIPESIDGYVTAVIDRNIQRVRTEIDSYRYPPIEVTAGIPVEWTIYADKAHFNECNHAIRIPDFGIETNLKVGETVVTFTPTKPGDYVYTCWMNMIKSRIRVIPAPENPEQTTVKPIANKPTAASKTTIPVTTEKVTTLAKTQTVPQASQTPKTVTLSGYIIDEDCFTSPGYHDPSKETRGCLLMPSCAAGGYGLAVKQADGSFVFYYFDGQISGLSQSGERIDNATAGQRLAWEFIDKNIKDSSLLVTVSAQLTGEKRTNPNPETADGIYYQVLKVVKIT